ncbi:MAG: fumarylacetoacetate hydrolase family protein [Lentisphaerae bacterium]|nr:fumarylacetoacetate hydrolase family protein [Lentisphaerota bacterium]
MFVNVDGTLMSAGRVFCIGCNYAEHVRELHGFEEIPPVIFMKPAESLVAPGAVLSPPPSYTGQFDYETELVFMIGRSGRAVAEAEAADFIGAIGIGCDLTLRTLQKELRSKSLPWECSKAFENSAPLGVLHKYDPGCDDIDSLQFSGMINGELRQQGNSKDMIYPVRRLIVEISRYWELKVGDLIFSGTPQGVGALADNDEIKLTDHRQQTYTWRVNYVQ